MALGEKRIETRSWSTGYWGPLAIHASKGGLSKGELCEVLKNPLFRNALGWGHSQLPPNCLMADFKPGHIVGIVNLIECCPMEDTNCLAGVFRLYPELDSLKERAFGDYAPKRWAWITEKPFRLREPISFKGQQGIRNLPADIEELICKQGWVK
jgi:hypothetical protein